MVDCASVPKPAFALVAEANQFVMRTNVIMRKRGRVLGGRTLPSYSPAIFCALATSASLRRGQGRASWSGDPISWTTVTSGSISIGRLPFEILQHRGLCAPTLRAPSMRR